MIVSDILFIYTIHIVIHYCRSTPIPGFLDDYAFVIKGLLDLYESSLNEEWLEFAENLQDLQDKYFWDETNGGYFSTTSGDPNMILRLKEGTS